MKRKEQCVDDWFVLVIGGGLQKEFQSKQFINFFVELFVFIKKRLDESFVTS